MKLATINLYQFAEQGFYWYEKKDRNCYQSREWKKKRRWVAAQIQALDADVLGFQEVFSVDALKTLVTQLGYHHFITADTPKTDPDDDSMFLSPVVALASRFPFKSSRHLSIDRELNHSLPIAEDFKFSRRPVCVTIETPDLGDVMVYVVHLKSKRPVVDDTLAYSEETPWAERLRDTLLLRSQGDILSMIQRGLESTLLYHDIIDQLASTPQLVVMGDLNDQELSSSVQALTQQQMIYEVGGIEEESWPEGAKKALHDHRLYDCFEITPALRAQARPYTHLHRGKPIVLDHILVSNALNPRNNEATGEVCDYRVLNHHIRHDNIDNKLQSDHGFVYVEIMPCKLSTAAQPIARRITTRPNRIWTKQATASELERLRFIEIAGGVYQSHKSYRQFKSQDKWKHFWAFFFDTNHGWVKSIYGSIPVSTLVQKKRHTIEHVIPRSFLQEYLIRKRIPRSIRFGAETNPFNLLPADRTLNSHRSSFQFDFNGDKVVRPEKIHLNPDAYASTGIDPDDEWVVPERSRGDIARAILYMLLVYEIDELYLDHLETLVHWAKVDVPSEWELAYNDWVLEHHGIRNPFIDKDVQRMIWLNDEALLSGLLCQEPLK
ncbi:MAG: endonuclease I [Proteobacteria bacterium]|nr:MAG: endonuclease I [Pseudomonadota bacterium]